MSNNQLHGKTFETDFLHKYYKLDIEYLDTISNTSIFDCPIGKINENVSVKTCSKNTICLGDVKRIYNYITNITSNEKIMLYILQYKQCGVFKKLVKIYEINFTKDFHDELFKTIKLDDIEIVDKYIKNIQYGKVSSECKKQYKSKCKELNNISGKLQFNPKIDSKNQRRLQCSFKIDKISKMHYNEYTIEEFNIKNNINLLDNIISKPRKFN